MEQGRQMRSDDLLVLRSDEKNLSAEQRADLRILSPNVVSVELPSPFVGAEEEGEEVTSPLLKDFQDFCREVGEIELDQESLEVLEELERQI